MPPTAKSAINGQLLLPVLSGLCPNLVRNARKVLHRGFRPSGAQQSYTRLDCSAVTLEGGIPPSNNPHISEFLKNSDVDLSFDFFFLLFPLCPYLTLSYLDLRSTFVLPLVTCPLFLVTISPNQHHLQGLCYLQPIT